MRKREDERLAQIGFAHAWTTHHGQGSTVSGYQDATGFNLIVHRYRRGIRMYAQVVEGTAGFGEQLAEMALMQERRQARRARCPGANGDTKPAA